MEQSFLLSVVIPNRNRAEAVVRAVLSLQDQTDEVLEIIVVDDCSDVNLDAEYGILEDLGVRIFHQPTRRRGAAARNRGALEAKGTFISFLDSDDLWLPGRYARIKKFAERPEAAHRILVSGVDLHLDGKIREFAQPCWRPSSSLVDYVYRDAGRVQTSMLTMATAIARAHPFDETLKVNQDTDLAMRLDRAGIRFEIDAIPGVVKDETDQADRVTTGAETADLSHTWYKRESHDWSAAARSGYHLQDRVWRLANSGRRAEALLSLARATFPPVSLRETARRAAHILLPRRFFEWLRSAYWKSRGAADRPQSDHPSLSRWRTLDAEASALCIRARETDASDASGRPGQGR